MVNGTLRQLTRTPDLYGWMARGALRSFRDATLALVATVTYHHEELNQLLRLE